MTERTFATRSGAIRAARAECRKLIGPLYEAFEGPDFYIHPVPIPFEIRGRFKFELSPSVLAIVAEKLEEKT